MSNNFILSKIWMDSINWQLGIVHFWPDFELWESQSLRKAISEWPSVLMKEKNSSERKGGWQNLKENTQETWVFESLQEGRHLKTLDWREKFLIKGCAFQFEATRISFGKHAERNLRPMTYGLLENIPRSITCQMCPWLISTSAGRYVCNEREKVVYE